MRIGASYIMAAAAPALLAGTVTAQEQTYSQRGDSLNMPTHTQQMPSLTFTVEGGAVISLPAEQYTVEFKIPDMH